ncbi:MAG: hypothetical protein GXX93_02010 [Anaerolineae bacterium]|nr:hypothetical protein [Anaerolineae bacterium]
MAREGGKASRGVDVLSTGQSLLDYDSAMLEAVAHTRGLDASLGRDLLVAAISEANAGPLTARLLWEELPLEQRKAMAFLAGKGGWLPAVYFESDYGSVRPFGPARLLREHLWEAPASVTEALLFRGLIFRGFSPDRSSDTWYIPPELLALLPAEELTELQQGETPSPLADEVQATLPAGNLVVRAVYSVVAAARLGEGPLAAAVKGRLASEAGATDEERLEHTVALGLSLAGAMGFVLSGRIPARARTDIVAWLESPPAGSLREVARHWLRCEDWHELLHAPGLIYDGGRLPSAVPARRTLLESLAALEPGRWYAVADLQTWMRRAHPDFLRRDSDFSALYMRRESGGEMLGGIGAWMQIEGRFVEEALVALNGLGAVSLGTAGATRCLRVESTAWWAAAEHPPGPRRRRPLTVSPDLTLHLTAGSPWMLRYQVESIAERAAPGDRYRITRASVRRALSRGLDPAGIARFLDKTAVGFGDRQHRDLQALAGPPTVTTREAMVLEPEDEDAYRSLLRDAGFRLCVDAELPGRRLLVRPDLWPAAEARLRALGVALRKSPS